MYVSKSCERFSVVHQPPFKFLLKLFEDWYRLESFEYLTVNVCELWMQRKNNNNLRLMIYSFHFDFDFAFAFFIPLHPYIKHVFQSSFFLLFAFIAHTFQLNLFFFRRWITIVSVYNFPWKKRVWSEGSTEHTNLDVNLREFLRKKTKRNMFFSYFLNLNLKTCSNLWLWIAFAQFQEDRFGGKSFWTHYDTKCVYMFSS